MIQYKEVKNYEDPEEPVTVYIQDNRRIPNAPENRDYKMMMALVAEGEAEILPADPKPPPIVIITTEDRFRDLETKLRLLEEKFEAHKNAGAFTPAGHGGPR